MNFHLQNQIKQSNFALKLITYYTMSATNISTKTTEAILNLLRTLPVEELDIIIKKIMTDLVSKRHHTRVKVSKGEKYFLKTEHIDMDYSGKTFDRNYLYENTR